MKNLLILLAVLLAGGAQAQVGISGGGNMLKGFGQPRPWGGLHVGLEIPRDDAVSIYGRFSHYFPQTNQDSVYAGAIARDINTSPYAISVAGVSGMNYNILEGGTRYYLGDGYDFGWAAYGGTNLMLIFNKVKNTFVGFDETLYKLSDDSPRTGSIFSLGFGLSGGVKYTMEEVGTFYFDVALNYIIFYQPSNTTAAQQFSQTGLYRPLIFTFNLGYRRDLIW